LKGVHSPTNASIEPTKIRPLSTSGSPLKETCAASLLLAGAVGVEPTRIDILTGISAYKVEDYYSRGVKGMLDGLPTEIIGREDLIRYKLKSGRLKDLDDAQRLC